MFAWMPAFAGLLAMGSSAWALEITEDYWIGVGNIPNGETINVRGDAILTVDFPQHVDEALATIALWDQTALEVRSGRINGEIQIRGDNRLNLLGGRFAQRLVGTGDAEILVSGGQFSGLWQFDAGSQHIAMTGGRGVGLSGGGVSLDFFSAYPLYSLDGDRSLLAGFSSNPPQVSTSTASAASGVRWRMHSTAFHPADSNLNGVVDLPDLNLVRNHFGRTRVDLLDSYLGETLPYDGRVDLDDLNRVRNAMGETFPVAGSVAIDAATPEATDVAIIPVVNLIAARTVSEPGSLRILTIAALVLTISACARRHVRDVFAHQYGCSEEFNGIERRTEDSRYGNPQCHGAVVMNVESAMRAGTSTRRR